MTKIYVIANTTRKEPVLVDVAKSLPLAKGQTYSLALDNVGKSYRVYIWRNGSRWQDEPTRYEKRAVSYARKDTPLNLGKLTVGPDDCLRG